MIAQWRVFLAAVRCFTRIPLPAGTSTDETRLNVVARFVPLVGAVVGAIGGAVYWLSVLFWPTSVAVVLSMLATVLVTGAIHEDGIAGTCTVLGGNKQEMHAGTFAMLGLVFVLLIKYNTLMALSAANLPFSMPDNFALGLIMVAGHGASRALLVSVIATRKDPASQPLSNGEFSFALLSGFAPALLLGVPGLIGLVAAIIMRITFVAFAKRRLADHPGESLGATQQLTEVGFYLGALATWTYI
jgi:adenosylcobinamide-GDP ribazoletransferase